MEQAISLCKGRELYPLGRFTIEDGQFSLNENLPPKFGKLGLASSNAILNVQFEQCKVGSCFLSWTKSASRLWSCILKETDATKEVFEISRRNWKPNTVRYAESSESLD